MNRAPLIAPDGRLAFQDKMAMTRFEAERWGVAAGAGPQVFDTPWGRLGVSICYDAEFPKHVRAQVEAGAWLVLVPTCTDSLHGFNRVRFACQARALENQCFVAMAPTVGEAPWSRRARREPRLRRRLRPGRPRLPRGWRAGARRARCAGLGLLHARSGAHRHGAARRARC